MEEPGRASALRRMFSHILRSDSTALPKARSSALFPQRLYAMASSSAETRVLYWFMVSMVRPP